VGYRPLLFFSGHCWSPPPRPFLSFSAPLAPALARETAVRLREAVNMGDVMAVPSVAANLPPKSHYAFRVRELSEILDLEGLEALADDMEQGLPARRFNGVLCAPHPVRTAHPTLRSRSAILCRRRRPAPTSSRRIPGFRSAASRLLNVA